MKIAKLQDDLLEAKCTITKRERHYTRLIQNLEAKIDALEAAIATSCDEMRYENLQGCDRAEKAEARVAELEADCQEKQKFMDMWASRAGKAEAKVAELEGTYARWKADWVDIDKTREAKIAELENRLEWREDGHDGIYCRNETIALLTGRIKELETQLEWDLLPGGWHLLPEMDTE